MKPIRRGFLFLLALALLTGFCLPAAADESDPVLTIGTSDGNVYENAFLDLGFRLEGWRLYDSAELAEVNQMAMDQLPEDMEELVQSVESFILMFAESEDSLSNVNITATYAENFSLLADIYGMQSVAEMMLETMRQVQESVGREITDLEVISDQIGNETYWGFEVAYRQMGVTFYQRQILIPLDDYSVAVTASALSEADTAEAISRLYRISEQP